MKAMVMDKFGTEDLLHLADIPTPNPADNEVQIQVIYSSVNPVDWKIEEGKLKNFMPHEFPLIPGWDAAGKVTAVGKSVKIFKIGDEVYAYCRKPTVKWGTYAEYVCYDADNVALKPKNINFAEAAAIPLTALTAWQAIFDTAHLKKGDIILIHGGAGGVGGLAIQFAKNAGAKIITTASQQNHDYVKKLGADYAIDYKRSNFVTEVKKLFPQGIDIVLDTIGGNTLQESMDVLKPQGRLVSIVQQIDPKQARAKNINFYYHFVSPNGRQLKEIAEMIEKGKVHAPHIEEMPLTEAPKAQLKNKEGHTKGKIVLKVT